MKIKDLAEYVAGYDAGGKERLAMDFIEDVCQRAVVLLVDDVAPNAGAQKAGGGLSEETFREDIAEGLEIIDLVVRVREKLLAEYDEKE